MVHQVQIIPWVITDASYIFNLDVPVEPKKTVFVGALHGMITAQVNCLTKPAMIAGRIGYLYCSAFTDSSMLNFTPLCRFLLRFYFPL